MKWKPFVSGKPYTCQDCPAFVEMQQERDMYRELMFLFNEHYVCPECEKYAATYVLDCQNPLHKLHVEAWANEGVRGE